MLSLPYHLGEKTPIISREEFDEKDKIAKLNPCLIKEGVPYTDNELYDIMMDNTKITTTDSLSTAMKVLMGTVYVFNGAYPKANSGFFTFVQKIIMNLQDRQPRINKVVVLAGKVGKTLP